jgi:hypothetical protein
MASIDVDKDSPIAIASAFGTRWGADRRADYAQIATAPRLVDIRNVATHNARSSKNGVYLVTRRHEAGSGGMTTPQDLMRASAVVEPRRNRTGNLPFAVWPDGVYARIQGEEHGLGI